MIAGKGVPLLGEEGWLRHQEDAAKPPYEGADGVVSPGERYNVNMYHNDHPVCAASEASRLFLTGAATPPVPGGEHPVLAIHSTFYDRRVGAHRAPLQGSRLRMRDISRSKSGMLAEIRRYKKSAGMPANRTASFSVVIRTSPPSFSISRGE